MDNINQAAALVKHEIEQTRAKLAALEETFEAFKRFGITLDGAGAVSAPKQLGLSRDTNAIDVVASVVEGKTDQSNINPSIASAKKSVSSKKTAAKGAIKRGDAKKSPVAPKSKKKASPIRETSSDALAPTSTETWYKAMGRRAVTANDLIQKVLADSGLPEDAHSVIEVRFRAWVRRQIILGRVVISGKSSDGLKLYRRAPTVEA